jgi:hypothetical protein
MTLIAPRARAAAALIAAVAGASLLLQYGLMVGDFAAQGKGVAAAGWRLLGYFTILTNMWVLAAMAAAAVGRPFRPRWMTAVTLAILLVGVVYHTLLQQDLAPLSARWIADQGVHTAVPILTLAWWGACVDKRGLGVRDLPAFIAFPLAYGAYCLARGAIEGWYPYFFVDVATYGIGRVLLNIAGLGLAFALSGLALVRLGQLPGRRIAA